MLTRPTTDVLLADCCRELTEHIAPALTDETLQVRVAMLETVLANAAVRAAHEIAWLRDETATLVAYARAVQDAHPSESILEAVAAVTSAPDSLHLADVVETYDRAGRAFEAALAQSQAQQDAHLVGQARRLLHDRVATEKQVMATYAIVGR